ncbi:MAG TPA: class I SAM-dependent methyltransferase [Hyphomonadaceae bacterium]|nr:class I SAM-dependent methyltransferase [Hyphomonadaceae bacterium]HPN05322.1 class I SAM-dependent methyltransferase [Hyphomonadaceae bacterium]
MAGDNAKQIADWNGAVGAHWAAEQERNDRLIRAFGEAALAAAGARAGEAVLDVGCGCGDTSLALADSVGVTGRVVGVDVSAAMLAVARTRANGRENVTFVEADASRAELPETFDLLYSRFGVMFFDEPEAAFRQLRKAIRTGGRVAFCCWQRPQDNPWAMVPMLAAQGASGLDMPRPDPHAPGPFAFADAVRLAGILEAAGFGSVEAEPFEAPMFLGSSVRSAAEGCTKMGPASRIAREAGPDRLPAITEAVAAALTPLAGADGSVALPGRVWVVTARAT